MLWLLASSLLTGTRRAKSREILCLLHELWKMHCTSLRYNSKTHSALSCPDSSFTNKYCLASLIHPITHSFNKLLPEPYCLVQGTMLGLGATSPTSCPSTFFLGHSILITPAACCFPKVPTVLLLHLCSSLPPPRILFPQLCSGIPPSLHQISTQRAWLWSL